MNRKLHARLGPVLEGHAAGHYTLPERFLKALRVYQTVDRYHLDAAHAARDRMPQAMAELRARIVAAAEADAPVPGNEIVQPVLDAEEERRRHEVLSRELRSLAEDLENSLEGVWNGTAEETIRLLGAALRETLAEVRKVAPALEGLDLSVSDAFLSAPDKQRDAYVRLRALDRRYDAIRGARRHLPVQAAHDSDNVFGEIENVRELYGDRWTGRGYWQPWPQERLARLIWLSRPEVRTWMPTPAEQDRAWAKVADEFARPDQKGRYAQLTAV